ncbi:MAG: hypothetical protein R3D68_03005 [Hyphomicrobiaceae bacterium]
MLSEIAENDATGEIAAIFADVRHLWGVPYVSAIQRHLATRPGVLEWAWEAVGPAFGSGTAQQAAWQAGGDLAVTPLPPLSRAALAVWNVDDEGLATIRATAEGFVRVAPVNMMFAALVKRLLSGDRPGGTVTAHSWSPPAPLPAPPPMVHLDTVAPPLREALLAFATYRDGAPFVPGLYRMLAHWPAFLAHLAIVLPPRLADPQIATAFDTIRVRIDAAAPAVLATLPATPTRHPMPDEQERQHFFRIGEIYRKTSPELIVLGRLVAGALPA